jgi:GNAT superfamily N-acetyltransferase
MFGRAFVDEPMMRWPLGAGGNLANRFTRCFGYFLESALPLGIVSEVGDATGGAVWIGPGEAASWDGDPWIQDRILKLADDGGGRYAEFWEWVERNEPDEPLWKLDSIAVDPAAQGQGVGGALVRAGLERARADGVGACLSTGTPRNVEIYARCGFRVVQELAAPGEGPMIWFMRWS